MQVQCDKCEREYHVRSDFGQERLWRLTCPHCGASMWVSAPVTERSAKSSEAPRPVALPRAWS